MKARNFVAAVCLGLAVSFSTGADDLPCTSLSALRVSALDRAQSLLLLTRLYPMLTRSKASRYVLAELKNDVEVSKSLLVEIEYQGPTMPEHVSFESSLVGKAFASDRRGSGSSPTLPPELATRLGDEGLMLYRALLKADALYKVRK